MNNEPGIQIENDYGTFGMIPTRLLRSKLSTNARLLYAILWDYAARATQEAWPSRRTLAADLGRSVDRVDAAVKELVDFGALRVEPRYRQDGGQTSNLYRILNLNPSRTDTTPQPHTYGPPAAPVRHQEQEPVNKNQEPPLPPQGGTRVRDSRGSRIPKNFTVTDEMREWAATEVPLVDVDRNLPEFIDYWSGVPGSRGVKIDWVATWRNSMRKKQEFAVRDGVRPQRRMQTVADLAEKRRQMREEPRVEHAVPET